MEESRMEESRQELIQQLIKIIDGDAYRKGTKKGMCHPEVTNHMMKDILTQGMEVEQELLV